MVNESVVLITRGSLEMLDNSLSIPFKLLEHTIMFFLHMIMHRSCATALNRRERQMVTSRTRVSIIV
jgi:predicted membrane protein